MKGTIKKTNGSPCYDGIEKISNVYLQLLFKAIVEVDERYFHTQNPNKRIKGLYNHLERVFFFFFYHQWSIIQSKYNDEVEENKKRIINGEIGKEMDDVTIFPDLVLHKGHDDLKEQEIVVEIKRRKWMRMENMIHDLEKLSKFMKKGFLKYGASKYKEGVFILIGGNEDDIKNQIKKVKNKYSINKRIYCIFCKGDNSLSYVTMGELLKSQ